MNEITINLLFNKYLNYLQAQNSNININNKNTFWTIDAGAMASILLDLYMNLQTVQNSIYPQYAVGDQVDQWLYSRGLPARGGITYGSVLAYVTLPTNYPYTIPINTVFTDSVTGNQYQTLQTQTVTALDVNIVLYALIAGNAIYEPNGATLIDASSTYTAIVNSCQIGQNEENDISCITRILTDIRTPEAGSRQTDYFNYALKADSQVTSCIVLPSFITQSMVGILGVFPLVGNSITQYQLDQGLINGSFITYNRTASLDIINIVNTYIQNLRLVGQPVNIYPNNTYIINTLNVTVSLADGYSLTTTIEVDSQDVNGNPVTQTYTVEQLIKRQIRLAICNQPYGATAIGNNVPPNRYITVDSLITSVSNQLNSPNGSLAQVLINLIVEDGDIQVPSQNASTTYIEYTYDIQSYDNILISVI